MPNLAVPFRDRKRTAGDGDQGGFSSGMLLGSERHVAGILVVSTTDTGALPPTLATDAESNTEHNPETDLRLTLRRCLIDRIFLQYSEKRPSQ